MAKVFTAPTSYQGRTRADTKPGSRSQSAEGSSASAMSTVAQILETKGSAVYSLRPQDSLQAAVDLLAEKRIGALLVIDQVGQLVGILSERDIVRWLAAHPGSALAERLDGLMTTGVQTCAPTDTLREVLQQMTDGRFRHLPVTEAGQVLGVISIGDVVSYRLTEIEAESLRLKQIIVG